MRGCEGPRGAGVQEYLVSSHILPPTRQQVPRTRCSFRLLGTMFEDVQLSVICHGSELEESGVSYLGEQLGEMWRMCTGKTQHRVRKTQNEICIISTKPQGTFLQDFIQTNDI